MRSECGELPPLDAAIFADTRWESEDVYRHLAWLKSKTKTPIHVVSAGDLRADILHYQRRHETSQASGIYASIPWFIRNHDGSQGMGRRQCTQRYKLEPINRKVRELVGLPKGARVSRGKVLATMVIGISWDERTRMSDSYYSWQRNEYPLVDERHTRQWCRNWWGQHFGVRPLPRSACLGCPFHNNDAWYMMKHAAPREFMETALFEKQCQEASCEAATAKARLIGTPFLHRSMRPLGDVKFDEATPMLDGFENDCTGLCGV